MFQLIYNITVTFAYSFWSIIMTIITGKMTKISPYHMDHHSFDCSPISICSDKYIKTNRPSLVSDEAKLRIIQDYIDNLASDPKFRHIMAEVDFPIFDGKEIIGSSNFHSEVMSHLKTYKL